MATSESLERDLVAWRRHLHAHPEVGFEERETGDFVAARLASMGLQVTRGIGGTGLVATLRGATGGRAVGVRADMDALALHEAGGDRPHASRNPGRMHACGHDGHMAMVLGAARVLSEAPPPSGTVHFVFQPGEEHGRGAKAMLGDGFLSRFPVDEIYGLHNMPGLPAGHFATRAGGIMASEDNFVIRVRGRGTHAARPHMGIDPIVVASEIVLALQTVVSRSLDPAEPAVVSVTEFVTDGLRNALPGTATLKGDTRSYSPCAQELLRTRMAALAAGVSAAHGAEHDFEYTFEFEPTVNSPELVPAAVAAAAEVAGAERVDGSCPPLMVSEDFGAFLRVVPGNFMFLGTGLAGEPGGTPLHSASYDFNDAVLATGARYLALLARRRLAA
jgi:amidohydrolase